LVRLSAIRFGVLWGVIQSGCGAQSIALREPFNTQSNTLRSGMEAAFLTYF
jgi:hypothetical protein